MNVKIDGMGALERRLDPRRIRDIQIQVMKETVEFAKEVQIDAIERSGTGNDWGSDWGSMPNGAPGRTTSDPGRVASGEMRDAVDSEAFTRGDLVVGEVGWLEGSPMWARLQEHGFYHKIAQRDVEGMQSLREAEEQGTEELLSLAARAAVRL